MINSCTTKIIERIYSTSTLHSVAWRQQVFYYPSSIMHQIQNFLLFKIEDLNVRPKVLNRINDQVMVIFSYGQCFYSLCTFTKATKQNCQLNQHSTSSMIFLTVFLREPKLHHLILIQTTQVIFSIIYCAKIS